jgi:hypothetical protein
MTEDVRGFVEDEKLGSLPEDTAAQFGGRDEPSPIRGGHAVSIVDERESRAPSIVFPHFMSDRTGV